MRPTCLKDISSTLFISPHDADVSIFLHESSSLFIAFWVTAARFLKRDSRWIRQTQSERQGCIIEQLVNYTRVCDYISWRSFSSNDAVLHSCCIVLRSVWWIPLFIGALMYKELILLKMSLLIFLLLLLPYCLEFWYYSELLWMDLFVLLLSKDLNKYFFFVFYINYIILCYYII